MRVSSNLVFDRSQRAMASLSERANALQAQISSTKRLTAPSSDAIAYRQLTSLRRAETDQTTYVANIKFADSQLSASDSALAGVESQLQRAREIAIQANSGTLSTQQRASLTTELNGIVEDLVRLANSTDSRGQPLFSGSSTNTPYVQSPTDGVMYTGVGEAGAVPIGDGAAIQATTSGERIFNQIPTTAGASDVFRIVSTLSNRLRTGADAGTAITDLGNALTTITDARASFGARGARLDLETARLSDIAITREEARSAIEDTDIPTAITELQKTLTVLQATQASFAKLSSLSLFDYLR